MKQTNKENQTINKDDIINYNLHPLEGAKENLLVCENGRFLKPARKGTCKKKFLCVKNGFE